jgi:hypothetical protein
LNGAQAELATRLANETPRNHLDVRHRLGKDGKRYGKVIDFATSELRTAELLDNLCNSLNGYELSTDEDTGLQKWVRSSIESDDPNQSFLSKEQLRRLENECADLMGLYEDALSDSIRNGEATVETVGSLLCQEMARYCPKGESQLPQTMDEL